MNTNKEVNDSKSVTSHIQLLPKDIAVIVEKIRKIILKVDSTIGERIKWNNPSFFYMGPMQPFNPKEYKREIAVFNLFKERIMLVLPSGAKLNDTSGLLEGDYKDGRRLIIFKDLKDVKLKENQLKEIIQKWIDLVEN